MRGITLRLYVRIQQVLARLGLKLPGKIMYIGGSDTLPPPLARDEEAELIARMDGGDESVKSQLIERNLRLVVYIARRFENTGINIEDLISIGTIGLIKGVSSYRPEKGTRLATYAAKCVENEILMYFRSRKKLQGEVSLNDSLDSDADGESLYLMDVVGVEDTMYLDIQDRDDCLRVRKLVHECLTEREEEVITSRYGLGGRMPRTQREVAKKLGISRSYVSRIEKRALQKLEEALGERE